MAFDRSHQGITPGTAPEAAPGNSATTQGCPEGDERKGVAWLEWDYAGPRDDGLPFEWKPSDWGYLDGRVVAVDYAATAEVSG